MCFLVTRRTSLGTRITRSVEARASFCFRALTEVVRNCGAWRAGYIVHGIKRRSSSYNHARLEHIMEEGA
jgi:hypothetical protein